VRRAAAHCLWRRQPCPRSGTASSCSALPLPSAAATCWPDRPIASYAATGRTTIRRMWEARQSSAARRRCSHSRPHASLPHERHGKPRQKSDEVVAPRSHTCTFAPCMPGPAALRPALRSASRGGASPQAGPRPAGRARVSSKAAKPHVPLASKG
jgi:hypothetical protein